MGRTRAMERLTERDEFGNADIIALSDMMQEIYAGLSFGETNALTDALNRLAAYEDTGLSPEEVMALKAPPNEPLTLEELREMDGEPVWVVIAGMGRYTVIEHCGERATKFTDGMEPPNVRYGT